MKMMLFSQRWQKPVIGLVLCACALPASLRVGASRSSDNQTTTGRRAIVRLNNEDVGYSDDLSPLILKLRQIFEQRKQQNFIRFGYESRRDLPLDERIEKTVFIKGERSIKLDVLAKAIAAIKEAGGDPVSLPIHHGWEKRDWTGRDLGGRLDPFTLAVLLRQPDSTVPLDAHGLSSLADLEIAGGIPIEISRSIDRKLAAFLQISKNGELTIDGKRIEFSAIRGALHDSLRANPNNATIGIMGTSDSTFGMLEDIYVQANGAGATRILLQISQ